MNRRMPSVIVLLCLVCLGSSRSWAQSDTPVLGRDQVDDFLGQQHVYPAFDKLGRGVSNALGGWLEIPLNIQERYRPNDAFTSGVSGAMTGLVKGVVRTGVGVYEAVTFFIPLPEDFQPILPTLPYFDRATKRPPLLLE